MLSDLRVALRTLAHQPAFALTATLVLALGIGANSAIFGLVDQLLLTPPGIAQPDRVVAIRARYGKLNLPNISVSAPDITDVAKSSAVFDRAAAADERDLNYTETEVPERLQGAAVSRGWFDVFGARPIVGRTFTAEEDQEKAEPVVILSYAAWKRLFAADPTVVGRSMRLNQKPHKIVGVMGRQFRWPRMVDAWVPLSLPRAEFTEDYRFNEHLGGVARLAPGVTFERGNAYLQVLSGRVKQRGDRGAAFAKDAEWGLFAMPVTTFLAGDTRLPILVLVGAVILVLMIACSNIAGLMVARTAARSGELAVRAALGASRWQLVRQTLAESAVLAVGAGVVGVGLGYAGTQLLIAIAPSSAVEGLEARLDVRVLLFTLGVAILAGLLFAVAPAWRAASVAPVDEIKAGGRAGLAGRDRHGVRSALLVAETALALVLLVSAGLLLRTLAALGTVNPGFDPHGVMAAAVSLPPAQYDTEEKQAAFYATLVDRLSSAAGVRVAATGLPLPFSGNNASASFSIVGRPIRPGDPGPHSDVRSVSADYFKALGIPLKRGRVLTAADRRGSQNVLVIDENLARQYWPNQDPVGAQIRSGDDSPPSTVVGIVGHVKHGDLATDSGKGARYYSVLQAPNPFTGIVLRTAPGVDPVGVLRTALRATDPALPINRVRSMEGMVATSLAPRRFVMRLLMFFAAIALVMVALGLYGIISYSVTQRTREIGVRMALGAESQSVLRLILRGGLKLTAIGVATGVVAAVILSRLIVALLYGISALDISTFAVTIAIVFAVAIVAAWMPARRASCVDPIVALRWE